MGLTLYRVGNCFGWVQLGGCWLCPEEIDLHCLQGLECQNIHASCRKVDHYSVKKIKIKNKNKQKKLRVN